MASWCNGLACLASNELVRVRILLKLPIFRIYKLDDLRHSNTGYRVFPVYDLDFLPSAKRNKRGRKGKKNLSSRFF